MPSSSSSSSSATQIQSSSAEKQAEERGEAYPRDGNANDTAAPALGAGAVDAHDDPNGLPKAQPGGPAPDKQTDPNVAPTESSDGDKDVRWVDFTADDPENPFNWSPVRKWVITALGVFFTAEVAATAGAYVPGITGMEQDLNNRHELSLAGISLYALGFGLPPLLLAPFSEVYGRRNIFLISHFLYTIFFLCVGFADNIATVLVGRFLQGAFGSTGSTLTGGLLADIFKTSDRGGPMALFATAAIGGTGFGPFWAGFVAQRQSLGWRWIQYIQAIFTGGGFLAMVFLLSETRGSVLLTRRAAKLRKQTGDDRYRARAEAERASLAVLLKDALTRPLWLLVSEPIVLFFSLWISFLWAVMYSLLESIGLVTALHGYTPGQTGLVFLSISFAAVLGQITNIYQNKLYVRNYPTKGPEARLYLAMVSAVAFPVGCFIYGWTSYSDVNIAGPIVGIVVLMWGVYGVYLAVFNYLADSYLIYASSALAAQSFSRNVFGMASPLFAEQVYKGHLGYHWSSSIAAFLGAALGVCPFVLFFYGKQIRAKSRFSLQLQKLEREEQERREKAKGEKGAAQEA